MLAGLAGRHRCVRKSTPQRPETLRHRRGSAATTETLVTRLIPDKACDTCGGMLVPPCIPTGFTPPRASDYVCLKCGRPYRWIGEPPRLVTAFLHEDPSHP